MRLLSKTLRYYLFISIPIFIISSIGFYFFLRQVMIRQVDESLVEDKAEILESIKDVEDDNDELYKNITCSYYLNEIPQDKVVNDRYSFIYEYDSLEMENESFRELRTSVNIQGVPYELVLQESFVERDSMMFSVSLFSIILFGLLTLGISIVNWNISKLAWLPFYKILNLIERFHPDADHKMDFDESNIKEFDILSRSLSKMTGRIREDFSRQKKFIDNISHELQTPIALASSHLELLFQHLKINDETGDILANLDNVLVKMKHMNKSLLLLSRIENEQYSDKQIIEISGIINQYIELHQDQIDIKRIDINIYEKTSLKARMNPALADILIGNLIRNAIDHNKEYGSIAITITENLLEISNSGAPLDVEPEILFNKYVHFGESGISTGLGLSIVKEICKYHGLKISYKIMSTIHVLRINFPALDSL